MTQIQIFYSTDKIYEDYSMVLLGKVNITHIDSCYTNIFNETNSIVLNNEDETDCLLENLFVRFNSTDVNPLQSEEAQKMIKQNKTHTSMSLGDIIKLNDKYYMLGMLGFQKLE